MAVGSLKINQLIYIRQLKLSCYMPSKHRAAQRYSSTLTQPQHWKKVRRQCYTPDVILVEKEELSM